MRALTPGSAIAALAAAFNWSTSALGPVGAAIDRAMDERTVFDDQAASTKEAQRRVLRMLCQEEAPADARIAQAMPSFERLMARFPHWVAIMAPRERIAYWQARRPEAGSDDSDAPPPAPVPVPAERTPWTMRLFVLLLCTIGFVMFVSVKNPVPARRPSRRQTPSECRSRTRCRGKPAEWRKSV